MANNLIYGAGINDADYSVRKSINGKRVFCHFYARWYDMLKRCYSKKYHKSQPTYAGCSVSDDWLVFSNFKRWMEQQDWRGKELDKDVLVKGNRVYSNDTCCFIPSKLNRFVRSFASSARYDGVSFHKNEKRFEAKIRNPFTGKRESLGYFANEDSALKACRKKKLEIAKQFAFNESNEKIKNAIINFFGE